MPEQLKTALMIQAEVIAPHEVASDIRQEQELKSYHINQRNEGIDLGDISGALMATRNMKMQTFVKEPVYCLNDHGGERMDIETELTPTLRAGMGGHPPLVSAFNGNVSADARSIGYQEECAPTLKTGTAPSVLCLNDQGGSVMSLSENVSGTLRAEEHGHQPIVMASTKPNAEILEGVSPTVTASAGMGGGNAPILIDEQVEHHAEQVELYDNHARDCRYDGPLHVAPTIAATYGTGGNNVPLIKTAPTAYSLDSKDSNSMRSQNPTSGCRETEQARTLDTGSTCPSKNQGGIAIVQPQESFCIAGNTIDRQVQNGGNGKGFQEGVSYTLTATDRHSVFSPTPYQEVVGTLMHRDHKGVNTVYVNQDKCIVQAVSETSDSESDEQKVFGQASYGGYDNGVSTLCAAGGNNGGGSENLAVSRNLVRRLTPLECERLQGFPDYFTAIPNGSDSARYKALGNSVAIPCVSFVMRGIAYFLNKQKEEQEEL